MNLRLPQSSGWGRKPETCWHTCFIAVLREDLNLEEGELKFGEGATLIWRRSNLNLEKGLKVLLARHRRKKLLSIQHHEAAHQCKINFNEEDIAVTINDMSLTSAAGPDRFPAILLKRCKTSLIKPLNIF